MIGPQPSVAHEPVNAASTFAAASSCMCGRTCEYTSNVNAALVCPSCSNTTFGETPTVNANVAAVCRRSYSRIFGSPARTTGKLGGVLI